MTTRSRHREWEHIEAHRRRNDKEWAGIIYLGSVRHRTKFRRATNNKADLLNISIFDFPSVLRCRSEYTHMHVYNRIEEIWAISDQSEISLVEWVRVRPIGQICEQQLRNIWARVVSRIRVDLWHSSSIGLSVCSRRAQWLIAWNDSQWIGEEEKGTNIVG